MYTPRVCLYMYVDSMLFRTTVSTATPNSMTPG